MIKVIAHRGASGLVQHENTLESFEKAIEIGADMVEFDVRKTKDDVLVVFHNRNFADTPIAWQNYETMEQEAISQGFHVPKLSEVLELCSGRIYMDIELKETGYEKQVINEIKKYADTSEYSIKSFVDKVSYRVKSIDPNIRTGLLLGREKASAKRRYNEVFPIKRLKKCRADFVSPNYRLIHFCFLWRMACYGYPVYVWTVNKKKLMKKFMKKDKKNGIYAIITDRPDILLELMGR